MTGRKSVVPTGWRLVVQAPPLPRLRWTFDEDSPGMGALQPDEMRLLVLELDFRTAWVESSRQVRRHPADERWGSVRCMGTGLVLESRRAAFHEGDLLGGA